MVHSGVPPFFFNTDPTKWRLEAYRRSLSGRQERDIRGSWVRALKTISTCKRACCPRTERRQAGVLLNLLDAEKTNRRPISRSTSLPPNSAPFVETNVQAPVHGVVTSGVNLGHPGVAQSVFNGNVMFMNSTVDGSGEPVISDEEAEESLLSSSFAKFIDTHKWRLGSGRFVEDVIHDAFLSHGHESTFPADLVRCWTIDIGNSQMKAWFDDDEWEEIRSSVPPLPPPTKEFAKSLTRFHNVQTLEDLDAVLHTTRYLPPNTTFDKKAHFDHRWADNFLRQFLVLLESGQLSNSNNLEGWYSINVWSLLDSCFLSLPDITIQRTDATCRSTAIRKNQTRTNSHVRLMQGRRLDGIIRSTKDGSHEYGAMEVARTLEAGTSSTKWLRDTQKLVRALRDMLGHLHDLVGHDPALGKELQVVGFITWALKLAMFRLCHPAGYVCVLVRDGLREAPSDVKQLKQLLLLLSSVVQMKGVVATSVAAVGRRFQASSEEQLLHAIMNPGEASVGAILPFPVTSP